MSELSDMAETISRVTASGVPITATSVPPTAFTAPIGLSGFAGSGKTAAANFIEQTFGHERRHIAEPLRRMLASLLKEYRYDDAMIERYLVGDLKESVIPEFGVTSRHLQITIGTEWGRELVDQDIWAHLWAFQSILSKRPAMNDSVRFPNEEGAIRALGGFTILILRPGAGPAAFKWPRMGPVLYRWFGCMWGVHDSERVDRLNPDYILLNDGTLEKMYENLAIVIDRESDINITANMESK